MITIEEQVKAEQRFEEVLKANNVKENTKTFYKYQVIFFNGVISLLEEVPPMWYIGITAGRNILEERRRSLESKPNNY